MGAEGKSPAAGAGSEARGTLTRETVFASELLGSSHRSICHRPTKATCPVCTAKAELASSGLLVLRVAHAFNPSS